VKPWGKKKRRNSFSHREVIFAVQFIASAFGYLQKCLGFQPPAGRVCPTEVPFTSLTFQPVARERSKICR